MDATTIAIDLAKDVFEIVSTDAKGRIRDQRRLNRRQFSRFIDTLAANVTVVMEACGSSHYWGRRCQARGAIVRLLSPHYVRPYVRRNKTDRTDAEALLEANRCGGLLPVPVKTAEHQAIAAVHGLRRHWQRTRTARINFLRGLLREHGLVFPTRTRTLQRQIAAVIADAELPLPALTRETAQWVLDELAIIECQLKQLDDRLAHVARINPVTVRLQEIPGIGIVTSTALVAAVPHIHAFRRARQFASWLGLTPREHSSGRRRFLGGISKQGNRYLRTLLTHGARAVLRTAGARSTRTPRRQTRFEHWALTVRERRGQNRATIAVANKLARMVWVLWHHDRPYAPRFSHMEAAMEQTV